MLKMRSRFRMCSPNGGEQLKWYQARIISSFYCSAEGSKGGEDIETDRARELELCYVFTIEREREKERDRKRKEKQWQK